MIKPINSVNNNPFADFAISEKVPGYYLSADYPADSYTSNEKEKKHKNLGWKIAVSALTVGFGTLALMKGLPKNTTQKLVKFKNYLTDKFAHTHICVSRARTGAGGSLRLRQRIKAR